MSQERSFERVNQKLRTRSELLRAAIELSEKGLQPSVADVADHAGISRATAYRYFSKPEDLIREALLDRVANVVQPRPGTPAEGMEAVPAAVADLVEQIYNMVESSEAMFRALLSNSVTSSDTKRGGRRVTWLGAVLEPLKPLMTKADYERLLYALCLMTGIETIVVLKDVCGLDDARAREVAYWSAKTLLAGVLRDLKEKAG